MFNISCTRYLFAVYFRGLVQECDYNLLISYIDTTLLQSVPYLIYDGLVDAIVS